MPDGSVCIERFAAHTLVQDVVVSLCKTKMFNDAKFYRLCAFDDGVADDVACCQSSSKDNSQCSSITFLDETHRLIEIDLFRRAAASAVSIELSLISRDRILSEWETLLVARCIAGSAPVWLVDTPEVCAFVSSVAAEFQVHTAASNAPTSDSNAAASSASVTSHGDLGNHVLTVRKLSVTSSNSLSMFNKVFVAFAVYYGSRALQTNDPSTAVRRTTSLDVAPSKAEWQWNDECVSLDVPVCDLPREAHLDVRLCAESVNNDNTTTTIIIGCTLMPIFDHVGRLRQETLHLRLSSAESSDMSLAVLSLQLNDTVAVQWNYRRTFADGDATRQRISIDDLSPTTRASIERCSAVHRSLPTSVLSTVQCRFIWHWRRAFADRPHMLPIVVRSASLESSPVGTVTDEIRALLNIWQRPARPIDAIVLLGQEFVDLELRRWAVQCLQDMSDDQLLIALMPLVQSLKFELYLDSALARFLLRRAVCERRVGQRLFWLLSVELQRLHATSATIATRFGVLLEMYLRIDAAARSSLLRQRELVVELETIARRMQSLASSKPQMRNEALRAELSKLSRRLSLSSTSSIACPFDSR